LNIAKSTGAAAATSRFPTQLPDCSKRFGHLVTRRADGEGAAAAAAAFG
jgi:hypothetical protein